MISLPLCNGRVPSIAAVCIRTSSEHQAEKASPAGREADCRGLTEVAVYRDNERHLVGRRPEEQRHQLEMKRRIVKSLVEKVVIEKDRSLRVVFHLDVVMLLERAGMTAEIDSVETYTVDSISSVIDISCWWSCDVDGMLALRTGYRQCRVSHRSISVSTRGRSKRGSPPSVDVCTLPPSSWKWCGAVATVG
jgi:hypothetical protein